MTIEKLYEETIEQLISDIDLCCGPASDNSFIHDDVNELQAVRALLLKATGATDASLDEEYRSAIDEIVERINDEDLATEVKEVLGVA